MLEFQCHYREEKWLTPRYFQFVEDFFSTANSSREVEDCEPPPCPTTIKTTAAAVTMTPVIATQRHSQDGEIWIPVQRFSVRMRIQLEGGLLWEGFYVLLDGD